MAALVPFSAPPVKWFRWGYGKPLACLPSIPRPDCGEAIFYRPARTSNGEPVGCGGLMADPALTMANQWVEYLSEMRDSPIDPRAVLSYEAAGRRGLSAVGAIETPNLDPLYGLTKKKSLRTLEAKSHFEPLPWCGPQHSGHTRGAFQFGRQD